MAVDVPPENSAQQKVNGDEVNGDSARGAMLSMQRIDHVPQFCVLKFKLFSSLPASSEVRLF